MEKLSISQPLGFRQHIQCQPRNGFDFIPFLDALLIALFIALNSSRFIMAPGATIDLVQMNTILHQVQAPAAVLTVDRNELFFFDGMKIPSSSLEETLADFVSEDDSSEDPVLLIKADSSISSENLFRLFEMAKRAGFVRVQLAAEEVSQDTTWNESLR